MIFGQEVFVAATTPAEARAFQRLLYTAVPTGAAAEMSSDGDQAQYHFLVHIDAVEVSGVDMEGASQRLPQAVSALFRLTSREL